jgi:hypothetical protein
MLDTLQRLARWLRPAAPLLALAGVALLLLCIGLLLLTEAPRTDHLLLPAIAGLVWCLCGYVFILTFQHVPAFPADDMRGWQRLRRLIARAWHWLLALIFIAATIAAYMLTSRIIGESLA